MFDRLFYRWIYKKFTDRLSQIYFVAKLSDDKKWQKEVDDVYKAVEKVKIHFL